MRLHRARGLCALAAEARVELTDALDLSAVPFVVRRLESLFVDVRRTRRLPHCAIVSRRPPGSVLHWEGKCKLKLKELTLRNTATSFAFCLMISMFSLAVFAADQPKIIIDSPTDSQTVQPVVIIKFHTENMIIQSPFGEHPAHAGPRNIGHLHVTVDDNSWYWVHSTLDPVVIAGLSPGVHRVTLELAGPDHKPIASQSVTFTIRNGDDEDARSLDRAQDCLKSERLS